MEASAAAAAGTVFVAGGAMKAGGVAGAVGEDLSAAVLGGDGTATATAEWTVAAGRLRDQGRRQR